MPRRLPDGRNDVITGAAGNKEDGEVRLKDKIIVVTGGGAGIGAATAKLCAEEGAHVIVGDIDEAGGKKVAGDIGGTFVRVDVSDEDSVRALFGTVHERAGGLNVLLHAAGILRGAYVPLAEFSVETFKTVLDINTVGSFLCAKYAANLMKSSGPGVIVLVSSGAATGGSSSFAYGTSKGGVSSLAIVLANSLAADNIRVNVVAPGNINTAMKRSVIAADVARSDQSSDAFENAVASAALGNPMGVARVLAWLASDDADYVRGVVSTR